MSRITPAPRRPRHLSEPDTDLPHQVALFRYGLIAELVRLPPGTPGLYRRLEAIAAQDYVIPGSSRTRVAAETLRDWLKRYRDGGFESRRMGKA